MNILGNAVKFTPEGGNIEADLYEEASPKGNDYIRSHLHIRDNGIGNWGNPTAVASMLTDFHKAYPDIHVSVEYLNYDNGDE